MDSSRHHAQIRPDQLHVVAVVSNPARYESRYRLYREFEDRMLAAGVTLTTVEAAFGRRPHVVTDPANRFHVRVRTYDELWHKENLINIGVSRLPSDWEYVAVVDADLSFARPDWAVETLQQLQHFPVVQMYSEISHLSPTNELLGHGLSWMEAWHRCMPLKTPMGQAQNSLYFHPKQAAMVSYPIAGNRELGSPGGAWAYRREAFDSLGGMIDFSLVGSADYFQAAALFGVVDLVLTSGHHPSFVAALHAWEARARRSIRKNVGLVPGLLLHHWHGKMSQRGYGDRWKLLIDHYFNPRTDLVYDSQGVLRLHDDGSDRMQRLRDDLRSYFRSRNEDSVDVS